MLNRIRSLLIGPPLPTDKLAEKRLDLIAANDVTEPGIGFGSDDNRVTLLFPDGRQRALPVAPQPEGARQILDEAVRLLRGCADLDAPVEGA